MYCNSRPKHKGYSINELFPDDLFPPGSKQKGKIFNVNLHFSLHPIKQCLWFHGIPSLESKERFCRVASCF